jgi:hypothetical protein
MLFLFTPWGLFAACFAAICVGLLLLPLYTTFQIAGGLSILGGLVLLPTHPLSGIAFMVGGVALITFGVKWRSRVYEREAREIEEAGRRASRSMDAGLRRDDLL